MTQRTARGSLRRASLSLSSMHGAMTSRSVASTRLSQMSVIDRAAIKVQSAYDAAERDKSYYRTVLRHEDFEVYAEKRDSLALKQERLAASQAEEITRRQYDRCVAHEQAQRRKSDAEQVHARHLRRELERSQSMMLTARERRSSLKQQEAEVRHCWSNTHTRTRVLP